MLQIETNNFFRISARKIGREKGTRKDERRFRRDFSSGVRAPALLCTMQITFRDSIVSNTRYFRSRFAFEHLIIATYILYSGL